VTAHYLFAHRMLPGLYFSDHETTLAHLRDDAWVKKLWRHAHIHRQRPPGPNQPRCLDMKSFLLVIMPRPEESPEAFFVALPVGGSKDAIYTLELSEDFETGEPVGIRGGWNSQGHFNYGASPDCSLDTFTSWLATRLV